MIKTDPPTEKSSENAPSVIDLRQEIADLGREFGAPLETQAVMDAIVERLVKRYGVGSASLWQLGEDGSTLQLAASAGQPKLPSAFNESSLQNSLLGKAVREQLPRSSRRRRPRAMNSGRGRRKISSPLWPPTR